jgi:peptidoglycan/xylan/chitin deacetylase (PgdA/CDA1 family)
MVNGKIEALFIHTACLLGVDAIFRLVNKRNLLVIMYHGVSKRNYTPRVYTQLPEDLFRRQMLFLKKHYTPVSLSQVIEALSFGKPLPERAALITFDDGLKNNYGVAFPILQEMKIPAAIFPTLDFIGSENIFWFDELYLILCEAAARRAALKLPDPAAEKYFQTGQLWNSYLELAGAFKQSGLAFRNMEMDRLRKEIPLDYRPFLDDFGVLSWNEIKTMHRSGLIEYGVHTATHRILSELTEEEWNSEIVDPKIRLEDELGIKISAFCYPNGRPGVDFQSTHKDFLRKTGYLCAFSTGDALENLKSVDRMNIGRISSKNDTSAYMNYFRLSSSGAIQTVKNYLKS